jgi:predicted nucleotidyltransferase
MKKPLQIGSFGEGLPKSLQRPVVSEAVEMICELYAPYEVWMFGSAVKGQANARSDIDMLVVMDSDEPRQLRGHEFREAFLDRRPRFDAIYFTPLELQHHLSNPNSFASSVMKAAVRVYPLSGG